MAWTKMKVQLVGLHETKAALARAIEDKRRKALDSLEHHGDLMHAEAILNAPFNTGFLRDNIDENETEQGDRHWATAQSNAEYSIFQELGTSNMDGKHYMGEAFNEVAPKFKEDIKEVIKRD